MPSASRKASIAESTGGTTAVIQTLKRIRPTRAPPVVVSRRTVSAYIVGRCPKVIGVPGTAARSSACVTVRSRASRKVTCTREPGAPMSIACTTCGAWKENLRSSSARGRRAPSAATSVVSMRVTIHPVRTPARAAALPAATPRTTIAPSTSRTSSPTLPGLVPADGSRRVATVDAASAGSRA